DGMPELTNDLFELFRAGFSGQRVEECHQWLFDRHRDFFFHGCRSLIRIINQIAYPIRCRMSRRNRALLNRLMSPGALIHGKKEPSLFESARAVGSSPKRLTK